MGVYRSDEERTEIGARLRQLRKGQNISCKELAQMFDITENAVQSWERGSKTPNENRLIALSKFYDVSLKWIICGDEQSMFEDNALLTSSKTARKIVQEYVGKRFRALREERKLTRDEAGAEFDMPKRAIGRWETGTFIPARKRLVEIAGFYGVSVDWILHGIVAEENELERRLSEMVGVAPKPESFAVAIDVAHSAPVPNTEIQEFVSMVLSLPTEYRGRVIGYLDALCSEELFERGMVGSAMAV